MTAVLSAGLTTVLLSLNATAPVAQARFLDGTLIETAPFQKEMPLARFLEELSKSIPEGKKVPLRLDEEAFGKDRAAVAKAPVKLPAFPRKMTLRTALRLAVARVDERIRVQYRLWPTHLALTTPERTISTITYNVRDLVEPDGKPAPGDPGQAASALVHLVLTEVDPQRWGESPTFDRMQILNGTRLVVRTTASRHEQVADLLAALRRPQDVAVVMEARLYEVERAFYVKHIAPLLVDEKGKTVRRLIDVDGDLVAELQRHTLVLDGAQDRLRPWERSTFLSLHTPFRYVAGPGDPQKEPGKVYRTGLAGVAFLVHPVVSADRRSIRLQITQEVRELTGIGKTWLLDADTGKATEVEAPRVRRASITATLEIWDGVSILMPVDYRSPTAAAKDRVWVLAASPRIYIEEEEEAIRKANLPPVPR
ncbi:MAG: hypothetical protein L0Z62_29785 [Gemmataceae bacterium]|nr:hypothetical protein [Gemmataceae bacterium]